MGFISGIIKGAIDTVKLPLSVTKDIVELVTDNDVKHTEENVEDIVTDIDDVISSLFE